MSTLLTVFFLLVTGYVFKFYYKFFTRPFPLPGPIPVPFFGNIFSLIQTKGHFADLSRILHKKYGDMWEFYMFADRQIWIARPDLVDNIFHRKLSRTHYFQLSPKLPGFEEIDFDTHGIGTNRDYELWRFNRKFLSQALLKSKFIKSIIPTCLAQFSKVESYWARLDPTQPIDLVQWGIPFSLDMVFKLSTHRDLNLSAEYFNTLVSDELKVPLASSESSDRQKFESRLVRDLRDSLKCIFFLLIFPTWVRHYVPGFKQKNKVIVDHMFNLYSGVEREIVKKRKAEIDNTPVGEELTDDLLTQLCIANTSRSDVRIEDVNGNCDPMSDYEIGRIMSDVFIAGTDSVGHSICFMIYHLSKTPRAKARLLEELNTVFGNDPDLMTYERLEKLEYLDAVIKEAARLNPTLNATMRTSSNKGEIGKYTWPEGTLFVVDFYNMHRHASYWADPDEFVPERWLEAVEEDDESTKKFFQYGAGARECPGRFLATSVLKVFMSSLLLKYEVRLADEAQKLRTNSDFLLVQCTDLKVVIKPKNV